MKDQALGMIALGVAAVGAAWTVHTFTTTSYYCPGPSASSVVALLAPCQAFDTALGHTVSSAHAVPMGLPWPIQPDKTNPPHTRVAAK